MIVMKFGGTSVGNSQNIQIVYQLIKSDTPKIVVVSAMAGTTNQLIQLYEKHKAYSVIADQILKTIIQRYQSTAYELLYDPELLANYLENLAIFKNIVQQSILQPDTPKFLNEFIVWGEIITSQLIFNYLKQQGVSVMLLDSTDIIHLTEQREPDLEYASKKMEQILSEIPGKAIYLIPGFLCKNSHGEIDNLERGGSDYTATILGASIQASEIQIWSDIDGLHNNDPRYVQETSTVSLLSFEEAEELAYFGAKVLHPTCILPAKLKKVPVKLKNTLNPNADGTLITENVETHGIKAIAAKDGITALRIQSGRMLMAYGFLRKIFEIFEKYQTPVDMITTSEISVAATIDQKYYLKEIISELSLLGGIQISANQTIICLVGNFNNNSQVETQKILNALSGIQINMISFGASSRNIALLIDSEQKNKALNLLSIHLFHPVPCSPNTLSKNSTN